jgi:hypothetical protein
MRTILNGALCLMILASCTANGQIGKIKGNGHITKVTRNTGNFKGVALSGSMEVVVTKGSSYSVVVEADDNLQEHIRTEVRDNVLRIGTRTPKMSWISSNQITVYVTLPELSSASVSGSGNLRSDDLFISKGGMDVHVSGSGNCKLNIQANKLEAGISGSGNITIKGNADESIVRLSGSGSYKGLDMDTKAAEVHISGSGRVETTVNGKLDAHISGSGGVRYKGNASLNVRTSGSGRVNRI